LLWQTNLVDDVNQKFAASGVHSEKDGDVFESRLGRDDETHRCASYRLFVEWHKLHWYKDETILSEEKNCWMIEIYQAFAAVVHHEARQMSVAFRILKQMVTNEVAPASNPKSIE
jgi:hypothetical protein